ncbi:hypothetical protein C8J55DRAFT_523626 [Lentinula edodes]|uniref:Uncharacterized protein n=1 Tax=Lentinula lateritia TaxID=40482 RepID=A0A9W8ZZH6_9AGAR|nr:hypothetical protein C8J55DRAFT_523626 [Lentinula edodes]
MKPLFTFKYPSLHKPTIMSLCPDCIKGIKHEGTPEGEWEIRCRILSWRMLLVDGFAKNGIKVFSPVYPRNRNTDGSKKMDFPLMYSNPRKTESARQMNLTPRY